MLAFGNTATITAIVMLSALVSLVFGLFYSPEKEIGVPENLDDVSVTQRLYMLIRDAKSWEQLIDGMRQYGYALFPSQEDIYGVNFTTRHMVMLSDSGHYMSFIIERLGMPPERMLPERYAGSGLGIDQNQKPPCSRQEPTVH